MFIKEWLIYSETKENKINFKNRDFNALQIDGPERIWFNSQTSEQTVLTENLRSILTQLRMSVLFWLN